MGKSLRYITVIQYLGSLKSVKCTMTDPKSFQYHNVCQLNCHCMDVEINSTFFLCAVKVEVQYEKKKFNFRYVSLCHFINTSGNRLAEI